MRKLIDSIIANVWWLVLGMWLTVVFSTVLVHIAEWAIVPVAFISLLPTLVATNGLPRWARFAAMIAGALSVQLLYWFV